MASSTSMSPSPSRSPQGPLVVQGKPCAILPGSPQVVQSYTPPLPANSPAQPNLSAANLPHEEQPPATNLAAHNAWDQLPPGWKISYHPSDGRMYYLETDTGRQSWTHPWANSDAPENCGGPVRGGRFRERLSKWVNGSQGHDRDRSAYDDRFQDDPRAATRRPDSHQCCAVFACLVMPPLGLCALFHSLKVGKSWKEGRYGDAMDHSRQSYNYAWFGVLIAIVVLLYFWLADVDWDFHFDEWFNFD